MQSVRLYAKGDLRVEQIADPKPPVENEVTLAVTVAGICGSDLHNYKTGAWISRSPSVAGHEFSGVVTALGAGVDHVALGDRVLVDSRVLCKGRCFGRWKKIFLTTSSINLLIKSFRMQKFKI